MVANLQTGPVDPQLETLGGMQQQVTGMIEDTTLNNTIEQDVPFSKLGYDNKFKYYNVMINQNYHIIENLKPEREIKDFNPMHYSKAGNTGLNFHQKYNFSDHQIVLSNPAGPKGIKDTVSKTLLFSNVHKQD